MQLNFDKKITTIFIDPLYELLLEMATGDYDNGTYDFKAVSCSCLISLVIVRGDTGKIMNTLTTLIMCPLNASPRKIIVSYFQLKYILLIMYNK